MPDLKLLISQFKSVFEEFKNNEKNREINAVIEAHGKIFDTLADDPNIFEKTYGETAYQIKEELDHQINKFNSLIIDERFELADTEDFIQEKFIEPAKTMNLKLNKLRTDFNTDQYDNKEFNAELTALYINIVKNPFAFHYIDQLEFDALQYDMTDDYSNRQFRHYLELEINTVIDKLNKTENSKSELVKLQNLIETYILFRPGENIFTNALARYFNDFYKLTKKHDLTLRNFDFKSHLDKQYHYQNFHAAFESYKSAVFGKIKYQTITNEQASPLINALKEAVKLETPPQAIIEALINSPIINVKLADEHSGELVVPYYLKKIIIGRLESNRLINKSLRLLEKTYPEEYVKLLMGTYLPEISRNIHSYGTYINEQIFFDYINKNLNGIEANLDFNSSNTSTGIFIDRASYAIITLRHYLSVTEHKYDSDTYKTISKKYAEMISRTNEINNKLIQNGAFNGKKFVVNPILAFSLPENYERLSYLVETDFALLQKEYAMSLIADDGEAKEILNKLNLRKFEILKTLNEIDQALELSGKQLDRHLAFKMCVAHQMAEPGSLAPKHIDKATEFLKYCLESNQSLPSQQMIYFGLAIRSLPADHEAVNLYKDWKLIVENDAISKLEVHIGFNSTHFPKTIGNIDEAISNLEQSIHMSLFYGETQFSHAPKRQFDLTKAVKDYHLYRIIQKVLKLESFARHDISDNFRKLELSQFMNSDFYTFENPHAHFLQNSYQNGFMSHIEYEAAVESSRLNSEERLKLLVLPYYERLSNDYLATFLQLTNEVYSPQSTTSPRIVIDDKEVVDGIFSYFGSAYEKETRKNDQLLTLQKKLESLNIQLQKETLQSEINTSTLDINFYADQINNNIKGQENIQALIQEQRAIIGFITQSPYLFWDHKLNTYDHTEKSAFLFNFNTYYVNFDIRDEIYKEVHLINQQLFERYRIISNELQSLGHISIHEATNVNIPLNQSSESFFEDLELRIQKDIVSLYVYALNEQKMFEGELGLKLFKAYQALNQCQYLMNRASGTPYSPLEIYRLLKTSNSYSLDEIALYLTDVELPDTKNIQLTNYIPHQTSAHISGQWKEMIYKTYPEIDEFVTIELNQGDLDFFIKRIYNYAISETPLSNENYLLFIKPIAHILHEKTYEDLDHLMFNFHELVVVTREFSKRLEGANLKSEGYSDLRKLQEFLNYSLAFAIEKKEIANEWAIIPESNLAISVNAIINQLLSFESENKTLSSLENDQKTIIHFDLKRPSDFNTNKLLKHVLDDIGEDRLSNLIINKDLNFDLTVELFYRFKNTTTGQFIFDNLQKQDDFDKSKLAQEMAVRLFSEIGQSDIPSLEQLKSFYKYCNIAIKSDIENIFKNEKSFSNYMKNINLLLASDLLTNEDRKTIISHTFNMALNPFHLVEITYGYKKSAPAENFLNNYAIDHIAEYYANNTNDEENSLNSRAQKFHKVQTYFENNGLGYKFKSAFIKALPEDINSRLDIINKTCRTKNSPMDNPIELGGFHIEFAGLFFLASNADISTFFNHNAQKFFSTTLSYFRNEFTNLPLDKQIKSIEDFTKHLSSLNQIMQSSENKSDFTNIHEPLYRVITTIASKMVLIEQESSEKKTIAKLNKVFDAFKSQINHFPEQFWNRNFSYMYKQDGKMISKSLEEIYQQNIGMIYLDKAIPMKDLSISYIRYLLAIDIKDQLKGISSNYFTEREKYEEILSSKGFIIKPMTKNFHNPFVETHKNLNSEFHGKDLGLDHFIAFFEYATTIEEKLSMLNEINTYLESDYITVNEFNNNLSRLSNVTNWVLSPHSDFLLHINEDTLKNDGFYIFQKKQFEENIQSIILKSFEEENKILSSDELIQYFGFFKNLQISISETDLHRHLNALRSNEPLLLETLQAIETSGFTDMSNKYLENITGSSGNSSYKHASKHIVREMRTSRYGQGTAVNRFVHELGATGTSGKSFAHFRQGFGSRVNMSSTKQSSSRLVYTPKSKAAGLRISPVTSEVTFGQSIIALYVMNLMIENLGPESIANDHRLISSIQNNTLMIGLPFLHYCNELKQFKNWTFLTSNQITELQGKHMYKTLLNKTQRLSTHAKKGFGIVNWIIDKEKSASVLVKFGKIIKPIGVLSIGYSSYKALNSNNPTMTVNSIHSLSTK